MTIAEYYISYSLRIVERASSEENASLLASQIDMHGNVGDISVRSATDKKGNKALDAKPVSTRNCLEKPKLD